MKVDDLGWLPPDGVRLDRDESTRAHAVTIAYVVADAIERTGGER